VNPAQHLLILGVKVYRWAISPAKTFLFGAFSQCRFTPTCSAYALEAIASHGALAGSWLALKRVARCHPWGGCGEDPVPKPKARNPKSERGPKSEVRSPDTCCESTVVEQPTSRPSPPLLVASPLNLPLREIGFRPSAFFRISHRCRKPNPNAS
jgi:putative membrane protein insertion efficiency factor